MPFPLDLEHIQHVQEQYRDLQLRIATNKKYKKKSQIFHPRDALQQATRSNVSTGQHLGQVSSGASSPRAAPPLESDFSTRGKAMAALVATVSLVLG